MEFSLHRWVELLQFNSSYSVVCSLSCALSVWKSEKSGRSVEWTCNLKLLLLVRRNNNYIFTTPTVCVCVCFERPLFFIIFLTFSYLSSRLPPRSLLLQTDKKRWVKVVSGDGLCVRAPLCYALVLKGVRVSVFFLFPSLFFPSTSPICLLNHSYLCSRGLDKNMKDVKRARLFSTARFLQWWTCLWEMMTCRQLDNRVIHHLEIALQLVAVLQHFEGSFTTV